MDTGTRICTYTQKLLLITRSIYAKNVGRFRWRLKIYYVYIQKKFLKRIWYCNNFAMHILVNDKHALMPFYIKNVYIIGFVVVVVWILHCLFECTRCHSKININWMYLIMLICCKMCQVSTWTIKAIKYLAFESSTFGRQNLTTNNPPILI